MPRLRLAAILLAMLLLGALLWARHLARRALPALDGERPAPGLARRVEIVRDRWGVPHVFAEEDDDAYFALGYLHAQDRLFQLDLHRHACQGRLAELFGERAVEIDRLFRTIDFHAPARRALEHARPEVRDALEAYARGVNAAVAGLEGRLPLEFALLRHDFEPVQPDDFAGLAGYMAWGLNFSWIFDPLYERLVEKVGSEHAAELFPYNDGGTPSVHPAPADAARGLRLRPDRRPAQGAAAARVERALALGPPQRALLDALPTLRGSNNWVVAPSRSASGRAILANDPHLGHGLPGIWYQAHLRSRTQDVIGVTLAGLPFVVIGHNRDIAWGFTNVMQDAADFFVERLDPGQEQVQYRGEWVPLGRRRETIRVKGGTPVILEVRSTPHGPIVTDLVRERETAPDPRLDKVVSYRWTYHAAVHANEADGFWLLDRARSWPEFRAALSRFGSVAQNVAYADGEGHIGIQTAGVYPRLMGRTDGTRFRVGWDGSEEWEGFYPFESNPVTFDPPQGWLASANNPTVAPPGPFYISSQWEPVDRILRIQQVLASKEKLSVEDFQRLQSDTVLVAAQEITPLLLAAFESRPPTEARLKEALERLRGWDGDMRAEQTAPALFAAFYRRLFYEIFEDELGSELTGAYRAKLNLSATMMRAVLTRGPERWFDRVDTPLREDRDEILRSAFARAVAEVAGLLGGASSSWTWGRLHTLTFTHPLGRASRLLGLYFDRGPFPVPGASATVNKMEYEEADFRVLYGASMRQITDFSDLDAALAIVPGGQSGLPASPHYDDLIPLWLAGQYHPLPLDRVAVERVAAHRLVLVPAP